MTSTRASRHLPFTVTVLLALMLTLVPLPDALDPFRPDWVVLILIYWGMTAPRNYNVGSAWVIGILLDVAQGTLLLGQHALALCVIVYITIKFHLLMRVFPLLQLTATVFALLALYQFLLFWINGVAGETAPAISYWASVITGAIVWPFLSMFLSGVRFRAQTRA
jgi:rod shape-determining protein MreD